MTPMSNAPPSSHTGRLGPETKVFGLGLNKTGTSSLKRAWESLGIAPIPTQLDVARAGLVNAVLLEGDYERALAWAEDYRGMEDRPWNIGDMYRRLHERFDDSLFILTVRDEASWWRSVHHWITVVKPDAQDRYMLHFEVDEISQEAFIDAYRRYNAEVTQYFEVNDPERFLVLDIGSGEEWEKLCQFFGKPTPAVPFPHRNRRRYNEAAPLKKRNRRAAENLYLKHCAKCDLPLGKKLAAISVEPDMSELSWRARFKVRRADARTRTLIRREKHRTKEGKALREIRARHPNMTIDDFGVVSCFFNPLRSRQRLINYRKFAEGMKRANVPLITVELAFNELPHYLGGNWEEVIPVRSTSVMWHKERLLNLGIQKLLDRGFEKIAWLDSDVEFINDDWVWRVAAELETSNLCQVFDRVLVHEEATSLPRLGVGSVKYLADRGSLYPQRDKRRKVLRRRRYPRGYSGFGWAANADVLRNVPLYDGAVVGGGDKLIYLASFAQHGTAQSATEGWFESCNPTCPRCGHRSTAGPWYAHYWDWAKRWSDVVGNKVGCVDNLIRDFYHGTRRSRQYQNRQEILLRQAFNPAEDLRLNSDGCFEWASDKPRMHEDLRLYFRQRKDQ